MKGSWLYNYYSNKMARLHRANKVRNNRWHDDFFCGSDGDDGAPLVLLPLYGFLAA